MTAATPGQAAYEVAQARHSPQNRIEWAKLKPLSREHWEAEAQAAIDVFLAGGSVSAGSISEALAAQDARPAPGYVAVNARDIAIALNGYAGFTGDPVSFASELHERLRRTVFADQPHQPQPAPELPREKWAEPKRAPGLAAAMDALTKVAESHERVMFAAAVDIRRGDPGAARILLGEQLGGWDGMPPWNGTETGAEYLERTGRESS